MKGVQILTEGCKMSVDSKNPAMNKILNKPRAAFRLFHGNQMAGVGYRMQLIIGNQRI